MHPRFLARRPLIVLFLATASVVAGARTPAVAHTEVLRTSPSPGEEVTGPVDSVELTFLDPVQPDVRIEVRDPSGEPVASSDSAVRSDDGRRASLSFPAVDDAGDYVVEYRFTALDGDTSRETYRFTLVPSDRDADAPAVGALVGAVGVGLVLVVGLAVALRRRDRAGG